MPTHETPEEALSALRAELEDEIDGPYADHISGLIVEYGYMRWDEGYDAGQADAADGSSA